MIPEPLLSVTRNIEPVVEGLIEISDAATTQEKEKRKYNKTRGTRRINP